MKTPEEGAAAPVWAATEPALEGVTRQVLFPDEGKGYPPQGEGPETAARLWELSAKLSGGVR